MAAATFALVARPGAARAQETADELFQAGVTQYEAKNYREAADLFARSYEAEPELEVLFAWAQCERLADNCPKALELYQKLKESKLSPKTRKVVEESIAECRVELGYEADPKQLPESLPEPIPPEHAEAPEGANTSSPSPETGAKPPAPSDDTRRSWYKDPIGGALVGTGVVAVGLGIALSASASSANAQADDATNDSDWTRLKDKAQSRGRLGIISLVGGGALIAAGVTWYLWQPVSVWADDSSAGVAVAGTF